MAKEYLVKRLAAWTAHQDLQQADRDGWLLITIDGGVAYFSRSEPAAEKPAPLTPKSSEVQHASATGHHRTR